MLNLICGSNFFNSAFLRVKENLGSAGVDRVTIRAFERNLKKNLLLLGSEIRQKTYLPLPLLKILVDKGNGESRALCIPTVRDRVAQTAVLQLVEPILEKEFEDCSFGYRKGRSVKQAVYRIKEYFDQGYRWVVDADIDAFFDSVDHNLLMAKIKRYITDNDIIDLIHLWIKTDVWDGASIQEIVKGIPQGSPISPILANLFLDELDEDLLKKGYKYVRYADDFIVMCKSPDKAKEALEFTEDVLEKMMLTLDESDVVSFDQGFKYLGVLFVKSMIMVPFDTQKRQRKVLYYPPPLDIDAYLKQKSKSQESQVTAVESAKK